MTKYPYFPFYVADFMTDTMDLSWQARSAYHALLDAYWLRGRGLVNDDEKLARIIGMNSQEWALVKADVLPFFTEVEGILVQKRIEAEIAACIDKTEQAKRAGKASAEQRAKASVSAPVQPDFNDRSTVVQRTFNHPDPDPYSEEYKYTAPADADASPPDLETPKPAKTKEPKHKHGSFKNVLLTDGEIAKLHGEFPNAAEAIEFLSEYREMKGYKAKSDYLAIRKWVFDALRDKRNKNAPPAGLGELASRVIVPKPVEADADYLLGDLSVEDFIHKPRIVG